MSNPASSAETSILKQADTNWLYVLGRLKPGVNPGSLQAKLSNTLRQWLATQTAYTINGGDTQIPKQHVVVDSGRSRHPELAAGNRQRPAPAHGDLRPGAAGSLRQHCESSARQGSDPPRRDLHPHGAGRRPLPPDPSDAGRKPAAGLRGRSRRNRPRLRRRPHDPDSRLPRLRLNCLSMPARR